MIKKQNFLLILIVSFFLLSCAQSKVEVDQNKNESIKEEKMTEFHSKKIRDVDYSVWVAYWALDDLEKELIPVSHKVKNVSHFAAYFNEENELFIPKETKSSLKKIKNAKINKNIIHYLTFVNDRMNKDATSSLKDSHLLYELLLSEKTRKQHIEAIIRLVETEGYEGIEIDYEGIQDDKELWQLFIQFLEELQHAQQDSKIPLRVLLEPNAPVEEYLLPEGPDYVLMCYNLHGLGTEAGPKADFKFLTEMHDKSSYIPGEVDFALATGGYDFLENGEVYSLSEKESKEILTIYDGKEQRDEESQALTYNYIDEDGVDHEIWYADQKTINAWIDQLEEKGAQKISLWKIGGNQDFSLLLR